MIERLIPVRCVGGAFDGALLDGMRESGVRRPKGQKRPVTICPVSDRALSWRRQYLPHCICGFPLALWRGGIACEAEMLIARYVLDPRVTDGEA